MKMVNIIFQCHNQNIQYVNTTKAICIDLMNNLSNSIDGVTRFMEESMTISKGTLCLWRNEIVDKLTSQIQNIENKFFAEI